MVKKSRYFTFLNNSFSSFVRSKQPNRFSGGQQINKWSNSNDSSFVADSSTIFTFPLRLSMTSALALKRKSRNLFAIWFHKVENPPLIVHSEGIVGSVTTEE